MNEIYVALFNISLFILLAEVVRAFLSRYNLPQLVGEILVGILVSFLALVINPVLGYSLIGLNDFVIFIAEFSILLLIFTSGMEHGIAPIKSSGLFGFLGATLGALLPFFAGYMIYSKSLGESSALFIGTSLGATSLAALISIIETEKLKGGPIDFLFSSAAVDDVVDFLLLSTVLTVVQGEKLTLFQFGFKIATLVLIWVIILLASLYFVPRISNRVSENYLIEFSFVVLFGLVLLMISLGYAPIIAAFVAGVAFAESYKTEKIKEINNVLLGVFGSIFFVTVGAEVNLHELNVGVLLLSLELTAIAFIFKWLGVFPFAYAKFKDFKKANFVAIGMTPRGETGLVIASIGISMGVINNEEFGSLVFMAILTTLIGSVAFKYLTKRVNLN
ncbi:MAG: cation:proton antiporter [Metallosphaera sp.]|uniref:cation:proton antiporter n=1 Tax=Metallosphaera sp. TaxID=2020860 RepID=UPI0031691398